jgi:methionyl-tRNA formyltransferase
VDAGHDVVIAVTEPDKRRGRGSATSATPVKRTATELGIPVTEHVDDVLEVGADLGVVVAFGRLIRPAVLDHLLMVNVHFSLLPRWRGAAPVERAILAGDDVTGVCLMKLDVGLDTGPVYACAETSILPQETAPALRDRLSALGADLLVARLAGGVSGLGAPVPQVGEASYAAKLAPSDREIDWMRPAVEIERLVRVGRAWTTFRRGRVIVWEAVSIAGGADSAGPAVPGPAIAGGHVPAGPAVPGPAIAGGHVPAGPAAPGTLVEGLVATGDGWLGLLSVQPEGRRRQVGIDWFRGARVEPGETFA